MRFWLVCTYELIAAGRRCPVVGRKRKWDYTSISSQDRAEGWNGVIAARKFCASFGLPDVKVEIADRRGLKRRRSSTVGDGEPILAAWPNLESQIIEILPQLETGQPILAVWPNLESQIIKILWETICGLLTELLRRRTDEVGINNCFTFDFPLTIDSVRYL